MKFKEKVGFICRNEAEWIECQKMLFKEGFYWLTDDHNKKLKDCLYRLYRCIVLGIPC